MKLNYIEPLFGKTYINTRYTIFKKAVSIETAFFLCQKTDLINSIRKVELFNNLILIRTNPKNHQDPFCFSSLGDQAFLFVLNRYSLFGSALTTSSRPHQ